MKKGKVFTKSLAYILALVMLLGVLPGAAFADSDPEIAAAELDSASYSDRAAGAIDISDKVVFNQDIDLTAYAGSVNLGSIKDSPSAKTPAEHIDYVKSVAESLTVQEGMTFDGLDYEEKYVFVWLQSMPDALEEVYRREGMRNSRYETVRENGRRARGNIRSRQRVNITHEYNYVFSGFALQATVSELEAIAAMDGVYAITEMEYFYRDNAYIPDPDYTTPGNVGARILMEIADLHAAGIDGSGVKVAIIDDGIDRTHPDLAGAYKGGWNFTRSDGNVDIMGTNTHGTHVAGTVASQGVTSLGVAPGVELWNGQVFAANGTSASDANTTAAIENFSQGNAARGLPKVDIINMSMGNNTNTVYQTSHYVRNNAVVAGVLIVNSAGNNAYPTNNTTFRNNYSLGSGGVSLPLTVAAAQYGGDPIMTYQPVVQSTLGTGTLSFYVENGDAATATGIFRNGSFGSLEARQVRFTPAAADVAYGPYPGSPFTVNPLVFEEGLGYELYYASPNNTPTPGGTTGSDMTDAEMRALQALPNGSLSGKILVVNRGLNFLDYKGQALRLGAGGLIVVNRDESVIGNLNIGSETSARDLLIFSAPASFKQTLFDLIQGGTVTAYLNPGSLSYEDHAMEPADFSSIGPTNEPGHIKPDITAPGFSILSTQSTGAGGGLTSMGGTSMSSPWVAGVAALVKQVYPNATPAEIKARLMNTADPDLIKPLSARLAVGNGYYFDPAGTETSVFEHGSGFVNPKRAVSFGDYGNVFITVANTQIPTGQTSRANFASADMASFSFGASQLGTSTRKLTATVNGGEVTKIAVRYNHDTRYSNKNLDFAVQAKYEIHESGTGFDVWLEISDSANVSSSRGGNLYEGYIIATVGGEDFVLPWATRVGANAALFGEFIAFSQRSIISTSTSTSVRSAGTAPAASTAGRTSNESTMWLYWVGTIPANVDVFLADPQTGELKYYVATVNVAGTFNDGDTVRSVLRMFTRTAGLINEDLTVTANQVVADGAYTVVSIMGDEVFGYSDMGIVYTSGTGDMAVQLSFDRDDRGRIPVSGDPGVLTANVTGRLYSPAMNLASENEFIWTDMDDILDGYYFPMDQSYNMLAFASTSDIFITSAGAVTGFYRPPGVPASGNVTNLALMYPCDADGYFSLNIPITQANKNSGWVFASGTNRSIVGIEGVYWFHGARSGGSNAAWNLIGANKSAATVDLQYGFIQRTVTFDSAGGSAVAPAVINDWAAVAEPAAPTRYGYTFAGWFLDDEAYDFAALVKEDITLVAAWDIVPISSLRIGQLVNGDPVLAAPMIQIGRNGSIDLLAIVGEGTLPIGIVWTVNNPNLASIEFDEDGNAVKVFTKAAAGNVTVTARAPSGVTHSIILRII